MAYSDKVVDHYENPRNVGTLDKSCGSVGTGLVGAPECGDVMRLQIRVNPPGQLDLEALKDRLEARTRSPWKQSGRLLKGRDGANEITLFADGRALVHGPMTPERARSWYW